eukprot:882128-Rhodomonas_salina.3
MKKGTASHQESRPHSFQPPPRAPTTAFPDAKLPARLAGSTESRTRNPTASSPASRTSNPLAGSLPKTRLPLIHTTCRATDGCQWSRLASRLWPVARRQRPHQLVAIQFRC